MDKREQNAEEDFKIGTKMEIKNLPLRKIKPFDGNAKKHDETQIKNVMQSIKEYGIVQPLVVDKDNVLIIGHCRLIACKRLKLKEAPVVRLEDLSEDEANKLRLLDNKLNESEWDFELLAEQVPELDFSEFEIDWGLDLKPELTGGEEIEKGSLVDRFIVPPFSVLDARQGYWQDRKRLWLEKTGNLSESRDGEFGTIGNSQDNMLATINGGTSNFDPVLAECMMKWFCPDGGHILDPFGGEQTKGVIAGECGFGYSAVEFRQEQVDVNNRATADYPEVNYTCGDSNNISKLIEKRGFDFCFTSPPYYDLEVYSKDDMSALGTYEEFMAQYYNIFQQCFDMLDDDTFLAIKVGEIRDKKTGIYRNFAGDTISTMLKCGFKYYNEIILVTAVGTLPQRVGQSMKTRKVGKMHQNVLVFYKGDPKNITAKFPVLDFGEIDQEETETEMEVYECSLK